MQIKVGVIGLGYWGPNFVRNFTNHPKTEIIWGCDLSEKNLEKIRKQFPQIKLTKNHEELINDKTIDLIVVATPPETHYKIAKSVLDASKHVLIAKPITTSLKTAKELLKIAKLKHLLLHGDLTYLYTGAVREIKKIVAKGNIGKPLYYDSTRSNLGLLQGDVNVVWDLAPHDFATISYLFGYKPTKIFAVASKHHDNSIKDEMAHITLNYADNFIAHIHVSWISPLKMRTTLIGGTKKMIYFNDVDPDEKVKIYDKGVDILPGSVTAFKPVYRSGDILIPKLATEEALFIEIDEIVAQISKNKINYENARLNIEIINLLEACDLSIKQNKQILLNHFP